VRSDTVLVHRARVHWLRLQFLALGHLSVKSVWPSSVGPRLMRFSMGVLRFSPWRPCTGPNKCFYDGV
jgi:hypothetical protein